MSTITKERLLKIQQWRETYGPGSNVMLPAEEAEELARIAHASLEAEAVGYIDAEYAELLKSGYIESCSVYAEAGEGCITLYAAPPSPVSVPDEYVAAVPTPTNLGYEAGWNACRAAMLQGADIKPELTIWYGSMPESNGKANWTAILHRKGEGRCIDGFTIDRSEYPGRVLYAADRVRYLIGEKSERPSILDYDADEHSGYLKPGNSPAIPDGLNIRAVAALREAVRNQWLKSDDFADRVYWKSMHDIANEIVSAMLAAAPQQEA